MGAWATPRSSRSAAITWMPGCYRSSRAPTRSSPSRSSPGGLSPHRLVNPVVSLCLCRGLWAGPLEDLVVLSEASLVERICSGQLWRCEDHDPTARLHRHSTVVSRAHELVFLHMAILDSSRHSELVVSSVKPRRKNLHCCAVRLTLDSVRQAFPVDDVALHPVHSKIGMHHC